VNLYPWRAASSVHTRSAMVRDLTTAPDRDLLPPLPPASVTPSAQPSALHGAPVEILDPYSQQVIICTRPRGAATRTDLVPVPGGRAGGGVLWAVRLLQLVLVSGVAVMIWCMLQLLQTTG